MSRKPSFTHTILSRLFIFLFAAALTLAQTVTTGVHKFKDVHTLENLNVDLVDFYSEGDGSVIGQGFCWDFITADGEPIEHAFVEYNTNVELMAGTAEAASNDVVDIISLNINSTTCAIYYWPGNLAFGQYHIRINSTLNSSHSDGSFDIDTITTHAVTLNVSSSSGPIGCGPGRTPEPFVPTSLSSPNYTSLILSGPYAGENVLVNLSRNLEHSLSVQWNYRDVGSAFSVGISNLTIQLLDSKDNSPVGSLQTPTDEDTKIVLPFYDIDLTSVPVKIPGAYKLQIQYRNELQDGTVSPGGVVTFTSAEFNLVDDETNCTALAAGLPNDSDNPDASGQPSGDSNAATVFILNIQLLASFLAVTVGFVYAM